MIHPLDKELRDFAETEMVESKEKLAKIEEEIKVLLIPKDKDDDKKCYMRNKGRCRRR